MAAKHGPATPFPVSGNSILPQYSRELNTIMGDENTIVRDRQRAIRREMDRRGISIKAVQYDGGWGNPSTVLSYFPADAGKEPAIMSVAALYRLLSTNALPADLLNLLLPDGFAIVHVPSGVDYDEISSLCRDFISAKDKAHHPDSEAGRDIGPSEQQDLDDKVVRLRA